MSTCEPFHVQRRGGGPSSARHGWTRENRSVIPLCSNARSLLCEHFDGCIATPQGGSVASPRLATRS